jgi:hypothetical protein
LQESTTYHFRVVATSSAGTVKGQDRTFTTEAFPQTTITSSHLSYTAHKQGSVEFESSKPGSSFKCSLDRTDGKAVSPCGSPYLLPEHLDEGPHTFVVAAVDSAGNADPSPARWTFNPASWPPAPATSKITSPEAGRKTGSYYTLQAAWSSSSSMTGVGFQMKLPGWDAFEDVPLECVQDGEGEEVTWPLPAQAEVGHSEPVFLGSATARSSSAPGSRKRTSSSVPSSRGALGLLAPVSR